LVEKVRKVDHDEVKAGAQTIYLAESRAQAEAAFRRFPARWPSEWAHGAAARTQLAGVAGFLRLSRHLWRELLTTNVLDVASWEYDAAPARAVNVQSVDRIIYSIFQRFNLEWKTRSLSVFTQAA
jgi:transposase-like protein